MTLRLADRWVWDHWYARDGDETHLFYLQAPRSLGDPDRRHWHATVGHAVSRDLRHWTVLDDALLPGPAGAWDDLAIWTGSVVAHDGGWTMLYTGCSTRDDGLVQRIGAATSTDLHHWERVGDAPLIEADDRWYERLDRTRWHDEAWRDPWVLPDPDGAGWHALVTARLPDGPTERAGTIGHAISPDLRHWEVQPPLTGATGFGHLEVPQYVHTARGGVLVFSFSDEGTRAPSEPGVRPRSTYLAPADGPLGPYDLTRAVPVGRQGTYSGRLVPDADGALHLLTFDTGGTDGFVGEIPDPVALDDVWPWSAGR